MFPVETSYVFDTGCVGGVCALANVLGKECVELQKLHQLGKHNEARMLQHRLIAPNAGVSRWFELHL
jgi:4-hydroxy-2-oxoglutarate aldolase